MNKRIYKKRCTDKMYKISMENMWKVRGNKKLKRALIKEGAIGVSRIDHGFDFKKKGFY